MFRQAVVVLVMALGAFNSSMARAQVITAATDVWPPYVDFSRKNNGYCLEIVQAAFKTQGYILQVENVPWARGVAGVKKGQYDIAPNLWYSKEREKTFLYSDAYASNTLKFIGRKRRPISIHSA